MDDTTVAPQEEAKQPGLSAIEVLGVVSRSLPGASHQSVTDKIHIKFVLYDAFVIRGDLDDYGSGGNWGFSIMLDPETRIGTLLGKRLSLCSDVEAIQHALATIDEYARLRLGQEYIAAYTAATAKKSN